MDRWLILQAITTQVHRLMTYDFWTDGLGADIYADGGSSDSGAGTVMCGLATLGVIAWLAL